MKIRFICMLLAAVLLTGCTAAFQEATDLPVFGTAPSAATPGTAPTGPKPPPFVAPDTQPSTAPDTQPSAAPDTQPPTEPTAAPNRRVIVIDAGHQRKGNYDREPVGPGASEMKSKVTSGTQGVVTGLEEYVLNLLVAEKLCAILEARDYRVVMVRTSHDVDISNAERAAVANSLGADAFIRIHANGSEDPDVAGIVTICQTPENPYNGELYKKCRDLSRKVLEATAAATGAEALYVWETDTMSGINWCTVPVTIVEMGFMSNPGEDRLLSTDAYQQKVAEGIADGIDGYFENS